jgi:outer membrane protein assembly factor BamB
MKRFCVKLKYALSVGLLAVAILIPAAKASGGSNWPQWRGPESQGISTETNLPTQWSSTKNIQWKTPVPGRGHSSPIVWEKRIFLTTSIEGPAVEPKPYKHMMGKEEFKHPDWAGSDHSYAFKVLCFDSETGKMLWEKTAYDGPVFDHRHKKNTYASPTPTTEGK